MRLFVAITPPAAVLKDLEARIAPLRGQRPDLRWAGPEAWHLTLAFLGEVSDGPAAALAPRLERAAHRHRVFSLRFGSGGAFPAAGRATVLWAGIEGDSKGLAALARSAGAGARRAGAPPPDEGRRYRPHLTLARCRQPADVRPLVESLAGYSGPPWDVADIHLMRSYLGDGPPRYETEGTWPLSVPNDR